MTESFRHTTLLADDSNLKVKNKFKIALDKYIKYNKNVIAQIPEGMIFDIFLTFCEGDMRNKLANINGIEKMNLDELWSQVEIMFLN